MPKLPQPAHPAGHPDVPPDLDRAPMVVTWEVSQACDLTCEHCRADARPDRHPDELTTAEGKAFLEDLAGFEQTTPILVFSGGDPLKRPDVFELAEHADHLGLPTAVTPAPTSLLDRDAIERFVDAGVRRMALSLDGSTPAVHDAFRGQPGSFRKIQEAADHAADLGLTIQINTTVTAQTAPELPAIADRVESLDAAMWEVFFLVPIGRGRELEEITPAAAEELLGWLYRRSRVAPFRLITVEAPHYRRVAAEVERAESDRSVRVGSTRAGHGFLFVSHTGEVYPSGFLPLAVGRVPEEDVVSVYRDAPLLRRLRDPDSFAGPCGSCDFRGICGGSRSRAYAATGDPLGSDPLCALVGGVSSAT